MAAPLLLRGRNKIFIEIDPSVSPLTTFPRTGSLTLIPFSCFTPILLASMPPTQGDGGGVSAINQWQIVGRHRLPPP